MVRQSFKILFPSHSMLSFQYITSWMNSFSFFMLCYHQIKVLSFSKLFLRRDDNGWSFSKWSEKHFDKSILFISCPICYTWRHLWRHFFFFANVTLNCCFENLSWFLEIVDHKLEFLKMISQAFLRKSFFIPCPISNVWCLS